MAYSTYASVSNMGTVLSNIGSFIGGLSGWTVTKSVGAISSGVGPFASGTEFIAYNGACLVGLRYVENGFNAGKLILMDGIGPYSSGQVGSLNGDSGLGSYFYTNDNLDGGLGQPNIALPNYNPSYYATPQTMRMLDPNISPSANLGPFPNMYLFSNSSGDYVHVVLQVDAVNYRHLLFGNLTQYGTWHNTSLGAYFCGNYWDTDGFGSSGKINDPTEPSHTVSLQVCRALAGGQYAWTVSYANGRTGDSSQWIWPCDAQSFGGVARNIGVGSVRGGFNRLFKNMPVSLFTGLVPMSPVEVASVNGTVSPATVAVIGLVKDHACINIANFSAGQEFSIGSDTWKVFPLTAKNQPNGYPNSNNAGLAYKKIT